MGTSPKSDSDKDLEFPECRFQPCPRFTRQLRLRFHVGAGGSGKRILFWQVMSNHYIGRVFRRQGGRAAGNNHDMLSRAHLSSIVLKPPVVIANLLARFYVVNMSSGLSTIAGWATLAILFHLVLLLNGRHAKVGPGPVILV